MAWQEYYEGHGNGTHNITAHNHLLRGQVFTKGIAQQATYTHGSVKEHNPHNRFLNFDTLIFKEVEG